jgi:hypothetical protein
MVKPDQKNAKHKTAYFFHYRFCREASIKSKQIHLYVLLIGKAGWTWTYVVVGSNWICQSGDDKPKLFILMLFCNHILEKALMYIFNAAICFLCVFLASLTSFRYFLFVLINVYIFFSIALIHNRIAVKLVRIQHGNFNEFNFTFKRFSAFKPPSPNVLEHSFSHPDLAAAKH